MADYRLYLLDARGRITRAVEFACEGDVEALQRGAILSQGQPAELWQRARKIGQVAATAE